MNLSEICIRRPVLASVLSLVLVLLGFISFERLTIREYPAIDLPSTRVTTNYVGATADVVESQVTSPIEDSLAGIDGIKQMISVTRDGTSDITLTFNLGKDADAAAADVRDRVARVRGRLPDDIEEPAIAKVEADSSPIYWMMVRSDRHSLAEITDYVDRSVRDRLQRIDGVAEAQIIGERRYAMRLWLNPIQMAARSVTAQDVVTSLLAQNREIPGGRVEGLQREFSVRNDTDINDVDAFNRLIIRQNKDGIVRLNDIGRAGLGVEDERTVTRYKGDAGVAIGIIRQSTANPLAISKDVRRLLPAIQADMPPGMVIETSNDTSVFIDRSIDNVFHTIVEAVVLVIAVIFVFLRSWRSTLIPMVTIPISLIGVFLVMMMLGFSINTLTLLAMVLAIGLVVDDAIVVMENIWRRIEQGMEPMQAAITGTKEIAFAVVAMTVSLAAVYVPVAFLDGRTGRLFAEFALTLAGAVMISGFVALTLTPMMSARILRPTHHTNRVTRLLEKLFVGLENAYRRGLESSLRQRAVVIIVALVVGGWIVYLQSSLRRELAPLEDRGIIFASATAPEGATIDYTDTYVRQMETLFAALPEANRYFVAAGRPVVTQMVGFIGLTDWAERNRTSKQIANDLGQKLAGIAGVQAFPITPGPLGVRAFDKPVSLVIQDNRSFTEIAASMEQLTREIAKNTRLIGVDHDLKINTPQLRLNFNRDRIADLGLDPVSIGQTLDIFYGNRNITRFKRDGEQYDVIPRVEEAWRNNPANLDQIFIRSRDGIMVPLSSVVTVTETVAPRELNHFNRQRAVTLSANLAPGYSLGEALDYLETTAKKILPASASLDYKGQSLEFKESSSGLLLTFLMALGFIYLVLAAQFESFVDPVIVLLTVPLSLFGALLALRLSGGTLNIYSQIGLITLIGLIAKNGILVVEFANHLQDQGHSRDHAIREAAIARMRPVLMTAPSMILGCLPLAFADGAGAESRQSIGWTIVGGMTTGTLLTGFVIPVAYSFLGRKKLHAS